MALDGRVFAGSRAVLIGVSAYKDTGFPPIRAADNSLRAMRSVLTDPALCGWPPELITVILNPSTAGDLADSIADATESTTGVLLFYYVGHGLLSTRGELCLTVTSTRPDRPKISGLPWETFAELLRACPARTRLAILDCCFAGQAIEALGGEGDPSVADITHVSGVYTLTATTRNRPAHVPPASQQDTACTSFTGELLDLIRSGIPGKPLQLTFSDIFPELRQRLVVKGLPAPSQRGTDTAYQFPFTANATARVGPVPRSAQPESPGDGVSKAIPEKPVRVHAGQARILDEALRAAESVTYGSKASTLARIARVMAATDPHRAARIAADAERAAASAAAAETSTSTYELAQTAEALAAVDPDRAERIAQAITGKDENERAGALAGIAEALAVTDPGRAERIAEAITDQKEKARGLAGIAKALAVTDPDRSVRIAKAITEKSATEKYWKAMALAKVAKAVAVTDPGRAGWLVTDAERLAHAMADEPSNRAHALDKIAEALVVIDPDRVERMAQASTQAGFQANIAKAMAVTDPNRAARIATDAERTAQAMADDRSSAKTLTLVRIAEAVAVSDPERAVRIAADAERAAEAISYEPERALASVAEVVAPADPGRAERIAQAISQSKAEEFSKACCLVSIAKAVAVTDPNRAARIATDAERAAQAITDEYSNDLALVRIAETIASTDPDRAERLARAITYEFLKVPTLVSIAESMSLGLPCITVAVSR